MGLFGISLSDWIQILIASIMLLTNIFTYLLIKNTRNNNRIRMFTDLVKEEREINKEINSYNLHKINVAKKGEPKLAQARELLFNFYEYLAILLFRGEIDIELFYYYFNIRIGKVYLAFMNSSIISDIASRKMHYPYLSKLFNRLGLSIKKISHFRSI